MARLTILQSPPVRHNVILLVCHYAASPTLASPIHHYAKLPIRHYAVSPSCPCVISPVRHFIRDITCLPPSRPACRQHTQHHLTNTTTWHHQFATILASPTGHRVTSPTRHYAASPIYRPAACVCLPPSRSACRQHTQYHLSKTNTWYHLFATT